MIQRERAKQSAQSICLCILRAPLILNLEVELEELFHSMSLPSDQLFAFYKVDKGFMICEDLYRDFSTLQVWSLIFKAMNDYQQLLVIDLIIAFCRYEVLTKEGHRVQQVIVFILWQDTFTNIIWGVTFQNSHLSLIKMSEHQWFSHCFLEKFKDFLTGIHSVKPLVLVT